MEDIEVTEKAFESEWIEWIGTQPHFADKGAEFVESLKSMCRSWYLRGVRVGVCQGLMIAGDTERQLA